VAGDVVELRELGDEPDEERQELDEKSPAWPKTWSSDESSTRSSQRDRRRGRATRVKGLDG
jgi:hypothetical protein